MFVIIAVNITAKGTRCNNRFILTVEHRSRVYSSLSFPAAPSRISEDGIDYEANDEAIERSRLRMALDD